jgi:hypothetical protein
MTKDKLDGVDVAIRWTVVTVALAFAAACVVLLLILWAESAQAQDLMPCIARGRVARLLVLDVGRGVPLEKINIYFRNGSQVSTDDEWVNGIRDEVRPLLGVMPAAGSAELEPHANAIGNKIAQACAYQLGRDRWRETVRESFRRAHAGTIHRSYSCN